MIDRTKVPRGIRLNNPGNIRHTTPSTHWEGIAERQDDPDFVRFAAPEFGIRAICRVLITYQDRHRAPDGTPINTVRKFIGRWAPPSENDTDSYVRHVAGRLGVGPDTAINIKVWDTMRVMVETIIQHECGVQPYTARQIGRGMELAGIVRDYAAPEPVAPRSTSAATTTTVLGGAGLGAVSLPSIVEQAEKVKGMGDWESWTAGQWLFLAILAIGLVMLVASQVGARRGR